MFLLFFQILGSCSSFVLETIRVFDLADIYVYLSSTRSISGVAMGRFNTQIREYHILFTDRTTDYVAAEDFDGIDLILF